MAIYDLWKTDGRWNKQRGRGKRWEVRYRDHGRTTRRRFEYRDDAVDFEASLRLTPEQQRAKTTVADLYRIWITSKRRVVKPKTLVGYESAWNAHLADAFGDSPVTSLRPLDVRGWFNAMESENAARIALVVLRGIMDLALEDGIIDKSPIGSLVAPPSTKRKVQPLSQAQVDALVEAMAPHDTEVLVLLACGLRFGEMAALTPDKLMSLDGGYALLIDASVQRVRRENVYGTPKSGKSRLVPVPAWLAERLPATGGLCLPAPSGGPWTAAEWRVPWEKARTTAGVPWLHTHDLRHTFAARQIEAGTDLKTLQIVMGHSKLSITVDLYGAMARPQLARIADITGVADA